MKNLIFINGTMGSGKTTVGMQLQTMLANNVLFDGDWAWMAVPFVVDDVTKSMALNNIVHTLNNFLHCDRYSNVIFCWVMDYQSIVDSILDGLDSTADFYLFTIDVTEEELHRRLVSRNQPDLDSSYARSVERLPRFGQMNSKKIASDGLTSTETARRIADIVLSGEKMFTLNQENK